MKKNFDIEFLKLENEKLKYELQQNKGVNTDDVLRLVNIANEMRILLEKCRQQPLPYQLANQIDEILSIAEELD